jgi:5-methylcytosine-specific restriction protein A
MASEQPNDIATDALESNDWSDAELSAAVDAYLTMLRKELNGTPYVKSQINEELRQGPLAKRTKSSVEFRMQNISATFYDLRLPRITGYRPAKNVGSSVKERIRSVLALHDIGDLEAYVPTADGEALAKKVSALRKQAPAKPPPGSAKPGQVTITTTSYVRDPAVKLWVLKIADGVCEGCASPAPFLGNDGFPYLEVHHVMPLASHGSDRISNAAALCPNCHRRCHHGADREEFKLSLYERIARLKVEVPEWNDSSESEYIDLK